MTKQKIIRPDLVTDLEDTPLEELEAAGEILDKHQQTSQFDNWPIGQKVKVTNRNFYLEEKIVTGHDHNLLGQPLIIVTGDLCFYPKELEKM